MIDRVFLSVTNDPLYVQGVDYVVKAWQDIGPEVNLYTVGYDTGNFWSLPAIPGMPLGNQAKITRMLATFAYPEDWCLISDADMLPLDGKYFQDGATHREDGKILYYTSELTGEDAGKYPACYMLAQGKTFAKYVNPLELTIDELVETWKHLDRNADPWAEPFSDESLYWHLFKDAPKVCLERHHQERRLCRSDWQPEDWKLAAHEYIDCHMPRPFYDNLDKLRPVLKSIGLEV